MLHVQRVFLEGECCGNMCRHLLLHRLSSLLSVSTMECVNDTDAERGCCTYCCYDFSNYHIIVIYIYIYIYNIYNSVFLCSTLSSRWDCSKHFTLHPLADLFIPTPTRLICSPHQNLSSLHLNDIIKQND